MASEHRFRLRELHMTLKSSLQPSPQTDPMKHKLSTPARTVLPSRGLPGSLVCILAMCTHRTWSTNAVSLSDFDVFSGVTRRGVTQETLGFTRSRAWTTEGKEHCHSLHRGATTLKAATANTVIAYYSISEIKPHKPAQILLLSINHSHSETLSSWMLLDTENVNQPNWAKVTTESSRGSDFCVLSRGMLMDAAQWTFAPMSTVPVVWLGQKDHFPALSSK